MGQKPTGVLAHFPTGARSWLPIQGVAPDGDSEGDAGAEQPATFRFPPFLEVLHWHGDTFDLPQGAVHLARSNGARHQAFQLGASVIALRGRALVEHCRAELVPSMYVQSEERILAAEPAKYRALNGWMDKVLTFITGIEPP